tara:strand:- start:742 stop:1137 length:396 start_codon:yes stop_codon:yes gene_type:complete
MLPLFYCKQTTISVLLNCMKILTTSATQSIKFIPRVSATGVILRLTNNNTRTSFVVGVSTVNSNGYMTITGTTFALVENTNYSMVVFNDDGSGVIYRDTIFCTNQTDLDKFDVHKDDYVTEDTFDNEFIVL